MLDMTTYAHFKTERDMKNKKLYRHLRMFVSENQRLETLQSHWVPDTSILE